MIYEFRSICVCAKPNISVGINLLIYNNGLGKAEYRINCIYLWRNLSQHARAMKMILKFFEMNVYLF
jgi:hypothetical protein